MSLEVASVELALLTGTAEFLIDANGKVVERYSPTTKPASIAPRIEELLGAASPAEGEQKSAL